MKRIRRKKKREKKWIGANTNDNLCALSRELKCIKQWMVENENKKNWSRKHYQNLTMKNGLMLGMFRSSIEILHGFVCMCVFFFKYMDGSIFWCILFHFSPSNLLEVYLMVVAFSPRVWRRKLNNQEYERTKNGKQDCGICYIWCEIIKVEKE